MIGCLTAVRHSPCGSSRRVTDASSACSTARTTSWPCQVLCVLRTSQRCHAAVVDGPYDVSLVEGSITTADDAATDP